MQHAGTYDLGLVAVSILIAVLASYTALDLAGRVRASRGWRRLVWLSSAAVAMGGGIWSMNFVGMMAFSLPGTEVSYDVQLTLLSLVLPIAVTAFGFFFANMPRFGSAGLFLGGAVMGLGIAGMYYTGMAAMQMPAILNFEWAWIGISIAIAVGAATVALWLSSKHTSASQRLLAALAMGVAVSGMHYSAMEGAIFTAIPPMNPSLQHARIGQMPLALWVTATTFLILALALVAATYDRHLARLGEQEAAALRRSEEQFRLLVQGVSDYAIFMLDVNGLIASWNAGAERIKGCNAEEAIGTHFSRFYTEEDIAGDIPARALQIAAESGKFEAEGWRVRPDGTRFWANSVVDAVRNEQGELIGFAKITRDITERKRAQEALEQAHKALMQVQKMEAIGQLTGGVAHDFNNLLMAVLGSLELLRKRLPDDPRLLRLLDNAVQGAQRGAALTQRMLAFARRQDLKPEPVDLPDLVRGMTDLLKRSTGPGIQIETRFPLGLPSVLVDANQLELALLNLGVNARDAMPAGGTITIAAHEENGGGDSGLPDGRYVELSVSDTGEGMDEDTLARAQEPFFTTKGVGKGTGLGLSMVHGLAEQSRGRLLLRSRLGEGTTAQIWLPVAPPGEMAESPDSPVMRLPMRETSRALTILVVDDDQLVLENTAAMLEDLGHRVIEAVSGEEALRLVQRTRTLDLVVTDYAMPGKTGVELAERIMVERPGLRLLLATGYAELSAAANPELPRLSKPFDQAALAEAVENAMRKTDGRGAVVAFRPKGV